MSNSGLGITIWQMVMSSFESQARTVSPYSRVMLLQAAEKYGARQICSREDHLIFLRYKERKIVGSIPAHGVGFTRQSTFLDQTQDNTFPRPLRQQALFVSLWVNDRYWRHRPPPADLESAILARNLNSYLSPRDVDVHFDSLQELMPTVCEGRRKWLMTSCKGCDRIAAEQLKVVRQHLAVSVSSKTKSRPTANLASLNDKDTLQI